MERHYTHQESAVNILLENSANGLGVPLAIRLYTISDSKVTDIIAEVPSNHVMSKLCGLAWAINRPVEEVVAHAFGFADRLSDFQASEVFRLWEVQQQLKGDDAKYYGKRIADLADEIDRKVRAAKKQGR